MNEISITQIYNEYENWHELIKVNTVLRTKILSEKDVKFENCRLAYPAILLDFKIKSASGKDYLFVATTSYTFESEIEIYGRMQPASIIISSYFRTKKFNLAEEDFLLHKIYNFTLSHVLIRSNIDVSSNKLYLRVEAEVETITKNGRLITYEDLKLRRIQTAAELEKIASEELTHKVDSSNKHYNSIRNWIFLFYIIFGFYAIFNLDYLTEFIILVLLGIMLDRWFFIF